MSPAASKGGTRRMTIAEQKRRTGELDRLRIERQLTSSEMLEADRLAEAAYFREYRAQRIERFGSMRAHARPRRASLKSGAPS